MEAHGAARYEDRALMDELSSSTPLSLKARETASLALKRIFEQQLQQQQRSLNFTTSSSGTNYDSNILGTADWPDLDLKLAPPSTSYTNVNARTVGSGQLTMIYGGAVCVYEDVSAAKAQAILLLASDQSEGDSYRASFSDKTARSIKSRPPTPSIHNAETGSAPTISRPAKSFRRSQAELPFARKASLTRFLEKRKERVEEKATVANKHITSSIEPPPKRPCSG